MKESYLTKAFRKTVRERFPEREAMLNFAFEKRLSELRSEHAGASKERLRHLESQIIPSIAIYETLQTVMPKDEALNAVHGYVEERAYRLKKTFLRLMRIPGLYKKVPGIFAKQTPKFFGNSADFEANEIRTTGGVWRIDMTRCRCFCDSDDITYDGLHPNLVWHRTKTLGRGDDHCDFCMKVMK